MKCALLFLITFVSLVRGDEIVLISSEKADFAPSSLYGTWVEKGPISKTETGVEISGSATARGGVRELRQIRVGDKAILNLEVNPLPGNEGHALNVLFEDNNGAQVGWRFDISKLPKDKPTLLVAENLDTPDFVNKPGSNGKLDLKNVSAWHIQGDFSSDASIKVLITKLSVSSK